MKFASALALTVGYGSAQNLSLTYNECWEEEGAYFREKGCSDLYFLYCDAYQLEADDTCNAYTYSRSAVKYLTSDIKTLIWTYTREYDPLEDEAFFGDFDFHSTDAPKLRSVHEEFDEDYVERPDPMEGGELLDDAPETYSKG